MVPILLPSPTTCTRAHTHTHTHDLLDICSEENRDVGVGEEDSHVMSQGLEHLKRKSGRGCGLSALAMEYPRIYCL